MKVKIQYTVDMEDVPAEVEKLKDRLTHDISEAATLISQLNPHGSIAQYEKLSAIVRGHLLSADLVLSDCEAILSGYATAKHSAPVGEHADAGAAE
jgi:hypothetical protein